MDSNLFEFLRNDEMVTTILEAFEVDGLKDRAIVKTASIVILVVVILLIIAIILATIIGLIAAGVLTFGTGVAAAPTLAIVGIIATFLIGYVFTAGLGAIELITSSISGVEPIADAMTMIFGQEIVHRLSPVKFHRVLWLHDRLETGSSSTNTERIFSTIDDNCDFLDEYLSSALGGQYRLKLVVETA